MVVELAQVVKEMVVVMVVPVERTPNGLVIYGEQEEEEQVDIVAMVLMGLQAVPLLTGLVTLLVEAVLLVA